MKHRKEKIPLVHLNFFPGQNYSAGRQGQRTAPIFFIFLSFLLEGLGTPHHFFSLKLGLHYRKLKTPLCHLEAQKHFCLQKSSYVSDSGLCCNNVHVRRQNYTWIYCNQNRHNSFVTMLYMIIWEIQAVLW